jgi:hypothetical protein
LNFRVTGSGLTGFKVYGSRSNVFGSGFKVLWFRGYGLELRV